MKISSINTTGNSFKAATVKITALSDTHGEIKLANNALEEMRENKHDIFCPNEKGKANVFVVCGDWYMSGNNKGYKSAPDKPLAYFQTKILNGFLSGIKDISKRVTTIFVNGNHEFDGGVELLDEYLKDVDTNILMTNLDLDNSTAFKKSKNKIINEKILEVEDDKNPKLINKILFLGISPVNLSYYSKKIDGVNLTDNVSKAQIYVSKKDYEKTLEQCKERISKFKQENPNGIVILLSHTGVNFADTLAEEAPVDFVFDGHEHKKELRTSNNTPIMPLYQNFKMFVNTTINIDDNGKLKNISIKEYYPEKNNKNGVLTKLYKDIFKEDLKERYSIKATDKNIKELNVEGIREGNSYLANFITDSILEEIRKEHPQTDFFALNSSAIRHTFWVSDNPKISDIDVTNALAGINSEDGKIMLTELTGEKIINIILDNFIFNKQNPQKNPIVQYSGLIINKNEIIEAFEKGSTMEELSKYVTDANTGNKIELNKKYTMANVEKYFIKNQNPIIRSYKEKSVFTGYNVHEMLKRHFEESNGTLFAKCDTRL